MAINQVLFEIKGRIHEQIVRDAFRLAGNKLPGKRSILSPVVDQRTNRFLGQWEFTKKGDAPIVGITKLEGVTLEELKRPRRQIDPSKYVETLASEASKQSGSDASTTQSP